MAMKLNGRVIDNSCPYEGSCFANMGCWTTCPDNLLEVLKRSAELEHELGLTPHNDPDLQDVCLTCKEVNGGGISISN